MNFAQIVRWILIGALALPVLLVVVLFALIPLWSLFASFVNRKQQLIKQQEREELQQAQNEFEVRMREFRESLLETWRSENPPLFLHPADCFGRQIDAFFACREEMQFPDRLTQRNFDRAYLDHLDLLRKAAVPPEKVQSFCSEYWAIHSALCEVMLELCQKAEPNYDTQYQAMNLDLVFRLLTSADEYAKLFAGKKNQRDWIASKKDEYKRRFPLRYS